MLDLHLLNFVAEDSVFSSHIVLRDQNHFVTECRRNLFEGFLLRLSVVYYDLSAGISQATVGSKDASLGICCQLENLREVEIGDHQEEE